MRSKVRGKIKNLPLLLAINRLYIFRIFTLCDHVSYIWNEPPIEEQSWNQIAPFESGRQINWTSNTMVWQSGKEETLAFLGAGTWALGSPPYLVFLLHFSGSGLGSLQSETLEKRNNASLTIIVASNSWTATSATLNLLVDIIIPAPPRSNEHLQTINHHHHID